MIKFTLKQQINLYDSPLFNKLRNRSRHILEKNINLFTLENSNIFIL